MADQSKKQAIPGTPQAVIAAAEGQQVYNDPEEGAVPLRPEDLLDLTPFGIAGVAEKAAAKKVLPGSIAAAKGIVPFGEKVTKPTIKSLAKKGELVVDNVAKEAEALSKRNFNSLWKPARAAADKSFRNAIASAELKVAQNVDLTLGEARSLAAKPSFSSQALTPKELAAIAKAQRDSNVILKQLTSVPGIGLTGITGILGWFGISNWATDRAFEYGAQQANYMASSAISQYEDYITYGNPDPASAAEARGQLIHDLETYEGLLDSAEAVANNPFNIALPEFKNSISVQRQSFDLLVRPYKNTGATSQVISLADQTFNRKHDLPAEDLTIESKLLDPNTDFFEMQDAEKELKLRGEGRRAIAKEFRENPAAFTNEAAAIASSIIEQDAAIEEGRTDVGEPISRRLPRNDFNKPKVAEPTPAEILAKASLLDRGEGGFTLDPRQSFDPRPTKEEEEAKASLLDRGKKK